MENIKQLLELNIEIEGLLRVAEYRKSEIVDSLLLAKSKKFLDILNAAIADDKLCTDPSIVAHSINDQQVVADTEVENMVCTLKAAETNHIPQKAENIDDIDDTDENIPDIMSEEIETVLEMDTSGQETLDCPIVVTHDQPEFNPDTKKEKEEAVNIESQNEISPSILSSDSNHVMRLDEMIHRQSSRDLKKAFSLNDRFRYIREIFNNDAEYFDETINNLEMLSNLDDVYDYLLGDIGLNHEDETVKDFLEIIYNHFNA